MLVVLANKAACFTTLELVFAPSAGSCPVCNGSPELKLHRVFDGVSLEHGLDAAAARSRTVQNPEASKSPSQET